MKLIKRNALIIVLVAVTGCFPTDEGTGLVSFNFERVTNPNGRVLQDLQVTDISITIEKADGETVLENSLLPLIEINGEFVTEPISLDIGNYFITNFIVLNNDQALFALPLEDSELAVLVSQPAPFPFEVLDGETTLVPIEVVALEGLEPEAFGFSSFSFEIIPTLDVLLSVLEYNESDKSFHTTGASLTVDADNEQLFTRELPAQPFTVLRLPDGVTNFVFTLSKPGFENIVKEMTSDALGDFQETSMVLTFFPNTDLASGLVADYHLNGNADDFSGNGNNGTINGAISTTDRMNNSSGAYFFDGVNDEIVFPHDDRYNQFPISMSFWAKFESLNPAVLGIDVTDNIQSGIWFSVGAEAETLNKIAISFGNGGPPNPLSRKTLVSEDALNTDIWYHIVGIIQDEANLSLYINGSVNEGISTGSATTYTNNGNSGRLGRVWSLVSWFNGSLDDVKIYNRVLTENEVMSLFNN